MSDIMKRLRDNAPADHGLASGDLMREAADEIERLEAIANTDTPELLEQHAEIVQLRVEIERLRGEAEERADDIAAHGQQVLALQAEIERLQAEVTRRDHMVALERAESKRLEAANTLYWGAMAKLQAEIERLEGKPHYLR